MSRREKIIIGLTVCAVVYVVLYFLLSPAAKTTPSAESPEDVIREFVLEVAQGLAKHDISETELMILKKTQLPWETEPFVTSQIPIANSIIRKGKTSHSAEDVNFRFTGYVEFGSKRLAIINDAEYEVGEQVEKSAYTVVSILATQVELKSLENDTITIPLLEPNRSQNALVN